MVPEVIEASEEGLLFEYLEPGSEDSLALAQGLAELHQSEESRFGFESNNFIGLTEQRNSWSKNWPEFFIKRRLRFQAQLGEDKGWFRESEEFEAYLERVRLILSEDEIQPSLLHGDLWSGNVYWSSKGPALIDPAVYFGDSEADLAFSEMFGGFSSQFYQKYFSLRKKTSAYSIKKRIYNLYHLMNHANIFGGSYCQQVRHELGVV